jgi:splicing factor 1
VVRGKGSQKLGKNKQNTPADNAPLHVHISAPNQESLDKVRRCFSGLPPPVAQAVAIVKKLLEPVDEANNDHKTKQLRELAQINGSTDR